MPCRATQDEWVVVESSEGNVVHWRRKWQTTSTFLPWESMNSMKRQKDMTLKDELPRLEGVHMLLEKSREIIPERPKLLLLLSRFSCVRLCATPWMAAYQAPPSLGFSRREHWSGLPFPSPVHESVKWKWGCSVVSNSLRPHGLQPTRLLRPWDFPGKNTGETGPK